MELSLTADYYLFQYLLNLGKASELHPMERIEHSTALIDLAGGSENMMNKMKQAYDEGKFQWALELADACIDTNNCVSNAKVKCWKMIDR